MISNSIFNGKRGNAIIETLLFIVVMFAMVLVVVLIYPTFTEMNSDIQNDPDMAPIAKERIGTMHARYSSVFDGGMVAIFAFIWLSAIIMAFFVDAHPVFFVVAVILLLIVFFVGAILGNTYEEIVNDGGDIEQYKSKFPISNLIFGHIVESMVVVAGSICIALFAKLRYL